MQRRKQKLDEAIVKALKSLIFESRKEGRKYIYNSSLLAQRAGTTRPSLGKRKTMITRILHELNLSQPKEYGATLQANLRNKILRLETEVGRLKKENQALREQHTAIYDKLYRTSADVRPLKGVVRKNKR